MISTTPVSPAAQPAPQETSQASVATDAWSKVELDDFITLLVTELQSQDPLEPMKNEEILRQISQIREIESNRHLTETLESVLLGQAVTTAGNLLGHTIVGLSEQGDRVTGQVGRVSIEDGTPKLHVGEQAVTLNNVAEILPQGEEA